MLTQFRIYLKNKKKSFYKYLFSKIFGPSIFPDSDFEDYNPNDKALQNVIYFFNKSGVAINKRNEILNEKTGIRFSATLFRSLRKNKKNNKRVKKTINLYARSFFYKPYSFNLLFYNNYMIPTKPKYLFPLFCSKYNLLLKQLINNGNNTEKKKIKFALYNLVYYLTKNQILVKRNKKIGLRSKYVSARLYIFFLKYLTLKKKSITTLNSCKILSTNYPGNITLGNFYNTSLFFFCSLSNNTDFYDQRNIWIVNNFNYLITNLPNNYDQLKLTVYPSKSILRKNMNYKSFDFVFRFLRSRQFLDILITSAMKLIQNERVAFFRRTFFDPFYSNYEKTTFFNNLKFFLLKIPFFRKVIFRRLNVIYIQKRKLEAQNNYLKILSQHQGYTFIYGSPRFPKIRSYKNLFRIFIKLINYHFKKLLSDYRIKFMSFGEFNVLEERKWRFTFKFLQNQKMIGPDFVGPLGSRIYPRTRVFWFPPKYKSIPRFMNLEWERFILFNPFRLNSRLKNVNYFRRIDLYLFIIYLVILSLFFSDPYLLDFNENIQNKIYSIVPCSFYILALVKYKTFANYIPFIFLLYSLISLLLYFLFHIFLQISRYIMIDFIHLRPSKHQKYKSKAKFRFRIFRKFEYRIPASFITTIVLFTILLNLPLPYYDFHYFCCANVDFNLKFILNNYFLLDYNTNFDSKLALNFVLFLFLSHYLFHVYFDLLRRYNFVNFLYKLHLYYYCLFVLILCIFFCNNYLILVVLIDFFFYCLIKISKIKYLNKNHRKIFAAMLFKRLSFRVRKYFYSQFSKSDFFLLFRDATDRLIFLDFEYGFKLQRPTLIQSMRFEVFKTLYGYLNFVGTNSHKLLNIVAPTLFFFDHVKWRVEARRLKFVVLSSFLSITYLYICTNYLIFNNYTYVSFYNLFFFKNFKDLLLFDLHSVLSIFLMISILVIKLGLGVAEFKNFRIIALFDNVTNAVYFSFKFISFLILLKFIYHFQSIFFYKNYINSNSFDYIDLTKKIDLIKFSLNMFTLKYDIINFSLPSTYELIFSFISISSMHYYYIFVVINIFLLFSFIKVIFFPIRPTKRYFTKTFRFLIIKNDIRWAFIQASVLHNSFLIFIIFNNLFPINYLLILSFLYACFFTFAIILLDIFIDQSSKMHEIVDRLKYYFSGIPYKHYIRYPFLVFFLVINLCFFGFTFPYFGFFLKFYLLLNNFYIFNFFVLIIFVYVLKKYSSNIIGTNFYTYIFNVISPANKDVELMYQPIFKFYYKLFFIHLYISKLFNFKLFLFLFKNIFYLFVSILIFII